MKSIMEKILGKKVQSTANLGLKGLKDTNRTEVIFFEVPDTKSPKDMFTILTNASNPPNARYGGASEYGCSIKTPNGVIYHALTTLGDTKGWRRDIEFGAAQHGLLLAKVKRRTFVVGVRLTYPLTDCRVEFF